VKKGENFIEDFYRDHTNPTESCETLILLILNPMRKGDSSRPPNCFVLVRLRAGEWTPSVDWSLEYNLFRSILRTCKSKWIYNTENSTSENLSNQIEKHISW